jgi:AraC family transcriptional regulator
MNKLYVKNMVCNRCILAVNQELEKLHIHPKEIILGEVTLEKPLTKKQSERLPLRLKDLGFELLGDQKQKQIEVIKSLLIQKVQKGDLEEHFSLSEFLSGSLNKDYSQITRLFSEVESITIEQFFILQKIEKVREWLKYNEFTLSEIAWKLGYSSVAHASAQFKKITGLSPSQFKKLRGGRKPLDKV